MGLLYLLFTIGKKIAALWYVTPYGLVDKYRHFGRTQCLCSEGEMIGIFAVSDKQHKRECEPFTDKAQTALFKAPVRTAL
jgi:hypothetical protein